MSEQSVEKAQRPRRRWSLTVRTRAGREVEVSLHPVSLVRLIAEVLDDAANTWCRRAGHVDHEGHCERCGLSLPDNGTPYQSWLPDAYRTIRKPSTPPGQAATP